MIKFESETEQSIREFIQAAIDEYWAAWDKYRETGDPQWVGLPELPEVSNEKV